MSNYIFEEEYFKGTMFTSLSDWWDDIPLVPDRPLTPAASSPSSFLGFVGIFPPFAKSCDFFAYT